MRISHLAAAAAIGLATLAGQAMAQELKPIGSITYEPQPAERRDTFQIRPDDQRIKAMRIVSDRGTSDIRSIRVVYDNGNTDSIPVRRVLQAGERTPVFEFRDVRPIKAIDVVHVPRGTVKLVLLAETRNPKPDREWKELTCKSVGFLVDRDVANVASKDSYTSLRLRSMNYDIDMIQMTVRYGNGSKDTYDIRTKIPAGGRIGPIDLRGERRHITQLEFVYRTRTIGNVKTMLCADGLK